MKRVRRLELSAAASNERRKGGVYGKPFKSGENSKITQLVELRKESVVKGELCREESSSH